MTVRIPETGADVNHGYHCDENTAMCGADLAGVPEVELDSGPICVTCAVMWLVGLPCPAPECPRGQEDGEDGS